MSAFLHLATRLGANIDTIDVRFSSDDLWPDGAEEVEVQVGVFHSYLDKVI